MKETVGHLLGIERSLGGRLWRRRAADERLASTLAQRLGVADVVGQVLAGRGVTLETGEGFLNPTLRDMLPDPGHLLDMPAAAARLAEAVQAGEAVAVFGDYDVDGATSSALLARYFAALGRPLRVYIPDRLKEGYGPNLAAFEKLAAEGIGVVVTVDCGTLAFEPLAGAAGLGLDVIVIDHHQSEPRLPVAHAVVNPNRLDENSPHRTLAAVGLVFLLLVALNRALRERGWFAGRPEPSLLQWLDLVALGTVCDVVPLTGLNRVYVAQGLKVLGERRNPGLRALADVAGVDGRPGSYHLGFVLGPRINAGGRVGEAGLGARLLATEDPVEAEAIAQRLDHLNDERRAIEAMVLEAARDQARPTPHGAPLVLVAAEAWHEGVVGIVAGRLKDEYRRPAFVLAVRGDIAKGSGRSVSGIDLGAAVTAARQAGLLLAGGGHAMAAGLTVKADAIEELRAFLGERLAKAGAGRLEARALELDGVLSVGGATRDLVDTLERAGPYGAGHSDPRFAIADANVVRADVVGADHVRVILSGAGGGRLKGIAFRSADGPVGRALLESGGRPLHLAGRLQADDWQGRRGAQLLIEDAAWPPEARIFQGEAARSA